MAYTIEAQGLTKAFGTTTVLDGLDLQVRELGFRRGAFNPFLLGY